MKICRKCKDPQDESEFHIEGSRLKARCKKCVNKQNREAYAKHPILKPKAVKPENKKTGKKVSDPWRFCSHAERAQRPNIEATDQLLRIKW